MQKLLNNCTTKNAEKLTANERVVLLVRARLMTTGSLGSYRNHVARKLGTYYTILCGSDFLLLIPPEHFDRPTATILDHLLCIAALRAAAVGQLSRFNDIPRLSPAILSDLGKCVRTSVRFAEAAFGLTYAERLSSELLDFSRLWAWLFWEGL